MTLEVFKKTRQPMTAHTFGNIIGDAQWDGEHNTQFLVYDNTWWIEALPDGRYCLTLENHGWITDENTTLSDLEKTLYDFTLL